MRRAVLQFDDVSKQICAFIAKCKICVVVVVCVVVSLRPIQKLMLVELSVVSKCLLYWRMRTPVWY